MTTNSITKDDLRGLKSPAGFQVLYTLLIGYYTIPAFDKNPDFNEFIKEFEKMPREQKRDILAKSACVTPLKEEEYLNVLCFCKDENGIPYGRENVENLTYDQIIDKVIEVCLAYSDCRVFF
jgi:hypothetical protein